MVRVYKRKTNYGNVDESVMRSAANAVANGKSVNSAAKFYGINRNTLGRYIERLKKATAEGADKTSCLYGYKQVSVFRRIFTDKQEMELAAQVKELTSGHGMSDVQIRKLAYDFAVKNNLHIPSSWHSNKLAGVDWASGFKRRNHLSNIKSKATSLARSAALSKHLVSQFFHNLASAVDRWNNNNPGKMVAIDDIPSISRSAYLSATTPSNVLSAFHPTGNSTFHDYVFSDAKIASFLVANRHVPAEVPHPTLQLQSDEADAVSDGSTDTDIGDLIEAITGVENYKECKPISTDACDEGTAGIISVIPLPLSSTDAGGGLAFESGLNETHDDTSPAEIVPSLPPVLLKNKRKRYEGLASILAGSNKNDAATEVSLHRKQQNSRGVRYRKKGRMTDVIKLVDSKRKREETTTTQSISKEEDVLFEGDCESSLILSGVCSHSLSGGDHDISGDNDSNLHDL